jgi:hypothetical protein
MVFVPTWFDLVSYWVENCLPYDEPRSVLLPAADPSAPLVVPTREVLREQIRNLELRRWEPDARFALDPEVVVWDLSSESADLRRSLERSSIPVQADGSGALALPWLEVEATVEFVNSLKPMLRPGWKGRLQQLCDLPTGRHDLDSLRALLLAGVWI